jgi:hypothetical protein
VIWVKSVASGNFLTTIQFTIFSSVIINFD